MTDLKAVFTAYPLVPVYGPVIFVIALTYLFKVLSRLMRDKRWTWFDRAYFYFGMPILWASFGRGLARLVMDIRESSEGVNPTEGPYLWFFAGWALCALFVFVIHATYDLPEAELYEELKFLWERDKARAAKIHKTFADPEPKGSAPAALQRVNLVGVAPLMALATFALYDYLFEQVIL